MRTINNLAEQIYSYTQLIRSGHTEHSIRHAANTGALVRLKRGVYTDPAMIQSLKSWEQYSVQVLTYFRSAPSTIFSHQSAAALLCLPLVRTAQGRIHVYCADNSRWGAQGCVKHPRLTAQTGILSTPIGALTTDYAITVMDCAQSLSFAEGVLIADAALHHKKLELHNLREQMLAYEGRKKGAVHKVALAMSDLSESPGETLTRLLLDEMGIRYVQQYWVDISGRRYRADFYLPDYGVFIEYDGNIKYTNYQPTQDVLINERSREKDLLNQGVRVFRTTWREVFSQPELFKNQLAVYLRKSGPV